MVLLLPSPISLTGAQEQKVKDNTYFTPEWATFQHGQSHPCIFATGKAHYESAGQESI